MYLPRSIWSATTRTFEMNSVSSDLLRVLESSLYRYSRIHSTYTVYNKTQIVDLNSEQFKEFFVICYC